MSLYTDIKQNKEINWFLKMLIIIFLTRNILTEEIEIMQKKNRWRE